MRAGVVERAVGGQLEREVVVAGAAALDELEAVGLVVAGEQRAAALRERSTSPNWSCQRAEASSRSATRRQTWSSRWRPDHGSRPSATMRSASSSGIASATWSVWAETCICSPGPARSTSHSSIVFVSRPMPGDLDLDDVARLHRPRVRGRAGEDHVARLERDQPAEVGELVGDREEQVVGRRLLHDLAVEVGAQGEVGGVELGRRHELGPEREEAVVPLDAQHRAAVGVSEVVHADVVRARVAADVVEHLVDRDALHPPPDHDRELALVVEEPRAAAPSRTGRRWPFSVVGGFMKYDGSGGVRASYSRRGSRR